MNLGVIQRAIHRHKYMHDLPAYREFLQHIDSSGNVWKVPQRDVASWWEQRQSASLGLDVTEAGSLRVTCTLKSGVAEVDGKDLEIPPFEIVVSPGPPPGPVSLTYRCGGEFSFMLPELLGHVGYGHLKPASGNLEPDVKEEELAPILKALHKSSLEKQRYENEDIEALRELLIRAHRRNGLPDLRLWTLPHRDGIPYEAAVSTRFDVDKAIMNLPAIHELEARHCLRSTAYLRPLGFFYGPSEIRRYIGKSGDNEIALHGEFVTTSKKRFKDEYEAALNEKRMLEETAGLEVEGVCMHGGELHSNTTPHTRDAIEQAHFKYDTLYRNNYFYPLHLPVHGKLRRTLSIGQHFADITVNPGPDFTAGLTRSFIDRFSQAAAVGGIFVPVMHPIYFDVLNYLGHPKNFLRLAMFLPRFIFTMARMRRDQVYSN